MAVEKDSLSMRIARSQIRFYEYAIACIDSYLVYDNPRRLHTFMYNLCKLNKGSDVLDHHFQPLLTAFGAGNAVELRRVGGQIADDLEKMNELFETAAVANGGEQ